MCLDHPDKVARAAILDIIPQHHLLNNVTRQWGTFSWHWFFMIQPYDFPERLMGADPDYFIEKKLAKTKQGLSFFDPAALAEYKRCFRNPATIHAMCEDYRATHGVDLDMDSRGFCRRPQDRAVRCCCCGARPAASAATTNPWRSGRAMRPISGRARRCPAGTIFRKKRRMKPYRELREFFVADRRKSRLNGFTGLQTTKPRRPWYTVLYIQVADRHRRRRPHRPLFSNAGAALKPLRRRLHLRSSR